MLTINIKKGLEVIVSADKTVSAPVVFLMLDYMYLLDYILYFYILLYLDYILYLYYTSTICIRGKGKQNSTERFFWKALKIFDTLQHSRIL